MRIRSALAAGQETVAGNPAAPPAVAVSRLSLGIERHRRGIVALFSVALLAIVSIQAAAKPFWYDEIYTVLVSRLPSVGAIWRAAGAGMDFMPPLNDLVTHAIQGAVGVGRISTRAPAILGFWMMCVIVFHLVRRRSNATAALAAMLLACFTGGFPYAYEARGYGLMLGLFALSLLAWSEAARGNRRGLYLPILAASLTAGLWNHYYAALTLAPILTGEVIRLWRTRKPDWGITLALVAAGLGALPLIPLIRVARAAAPTFWHGAGPGDLVDAYMLVAGALGGMRFLVGGAIVSVALVASLTMSAKHPARQRLPPHEIAAGVACLAIPAFGVLVGLIATGVFVPRYGLSTVLGLALVVPLAVWRADGREGLATTILCTGLCIAFVQLGYQTLERVRFMGHDPIDDHPLLERALARGEPVAVTGRLFLETWYYTPPDLRQGIRYLADPAAALRLTGSDTMDRGYLALRNWQRLPVEDYRTFVATCASFDVYVGSTTPWLLESLKENGASIREVGREGGATLYQVALPTARQPAESLAPVPAGNGQAAQRPADYPPLRDADLSMRRTDG